MKIIGLDVGEKRIGVAVADAAVRIAIPDCTIEVNGAELEQIRQIATSYRTSLFVLGLPRNVAGEETAQSQTVRQFAKVLKDYIPEAKVKFQDETLTSVEAERRLSERKRNYQKAEVDAEAASIILQDFIENFTAELEEKARSRLEQEKSQRSKSGGLKKKAKATALGVAGAAAVRKAGKTAATGVAEAKLGSEVAGVANVASAGVAVAEVAGATRKSASKVSGRVRKGLGGRSGSTGGRNASAYAGGAPGVRNAGIAQPSARSTTLAAPVAKNAVKPASEPQEGPSLGVAESYTTNVKKQQADALMAELTQATEELEREESAKSTSNLKNSAKSAQNAQILGKTGVNSGQSFSTSAQNSTNLHQNSTNLAQKSTPSAKNQAPTMKTPTTTKTLAQNATRTPSEAPEAPVPSKDAKTSENPKTAHKEAEKPAKKHSKAWLIAISILLFILLAGGVGGFLAYGWYNDSLTPVAHVPSCENSSDKACDNIQFAIADGESSKEIGDNLEAAGIIRNSLAFQLYLRFNNKENQLKTGTYSLNQTYSVEKLVEMFIEGTGESDDNVFKITFLPGDSLKAVKQKLIDQGYTSAVVEAAFAKDYDHPVLADRPEGASLEGYIYGDTYEFYKGESVENIILTTLNQLYKVVEDNNLVAAYQAQGLNLYQGITLASIVQKEAKADDQPTVAQVFLTRLAQGLPLGSDVTTQYALDLVDPDRTTYTNNTLALQVDSPYNTRIYQGLPPGPISNPGQSALLAVAHPSSTNYLFFLTGDDGLMYYSSTDAEHQRNISQHCQELCNVKL